MSVKITDNTPAVLSKMQRAIDSGLARAAVDMLSISKDKVPFLTGQLQSSGRTQRLGTYSYEVSYNTAYARRRYFSNISGEIKWFESTARQVGQNASRYFKL